VSSIGIAAHVRSSACGPPVNSKNCFTPCRMPPSSFLPGGVGSTFDISVTPWPSIHVDQASKACHRHVFQSPLLSPSDDPPIEWPPPRRLHTALMKTGLHWHLLMSYQQLSMYAALWTSSFHLLGGLKRSHLLALLRFRLGAHDLRVE
jgi:hypothetical protein